MGPKRNLTLDLNAATNGGGGSSKRARGGGGGGGGILTSPDVNKLGLTSPQIKQLLERGPTHGLTPTPGAGPSGYIFPPTTSNQGQQELLVKQFAEAQKAQSVPTTRAAKQMSGGGLLLPSTIAETVSADQPERPQSSASSSDSSDQLEIKQEPEEEELSTQQPSKGKGGRKGFKGRKGAGAFAPIDMGNQEMIKLERKRSRNRVAATKCRKKKLEKISKLEDKVNHLKGENTVLATTLKQLKENVCNLKQEIMAHVNQGCKIDT